MSMRTMISAAILSLCFAGISIGGTKSVVLVPLNGTKVPIQLKGNEKEYYLLRHNAPLKVQLEGPGKFTVISRLKLDATSAETEKYSLRVTEGKNTLKVQSTQTGKSDDAVFKSSGEIAGKSRKFSLLVPEGSATYEVFLDDTPKEAAVRFLMKPSKGKRKLVAIEPLSYDRVVTANIKENLVVYYVATREHAVQFRAVGPTKVQVSARLNYDQSMKGEQKYSLVIREGSRDAGVKSLVTTKSVDLAYEEWKEVVPGKTNSVSLDVPAGEHTFQITIGESIGRSVSLRFSIPKKDLGNE